MAEIEVKYHIGQYVEAFLEAEWCPSVVTSVQNSDPPEYGVITIKKSKNFFLTEDSLRCRPERLLLADDSLDESYNGGDLEMPQEVNFSLVSSDDETLFITQSNPVCLTPEKESPNHSLLDDSLLEFTKKTEAVLTLSSPVRDELDVNGCQLEQAPVGISYDDGDFNNANHGPDIVSEVEKSDQHGGIEVDEVLYNELLNNEFEEGGEDVQNPGVDCPQKKASVRFAEVDERQMEELQMAAKSMRTHKQTVWGVKILRDWLRVKGRSEDFANLPDDELGPLLKNFYASARTKDGELYSKASLQCIRAAIQRYVQGPPFNRTINLISGSAFIQANAVIQGMIKKMRKEGNDKSSRHTPIAPDDLKRLYSSGAFLLTTPTTLQYKVFFEISLHFGRRGREGLRELQTNMIVLEKDAKGQEYATLACQPHEKNHDGTSGHTIEHVQRMYETRQASCPIVSLKLYLHHLNPDNCWFFQRPKTSNFENKVIWYTDRPLGVNTISGLMPKICASANLSKRYTNHCIRATTVTTLREAGVAPNDIAAVTGHRSLASIDHYSRVSDKTRSDMSKELAAACSPIKKSPRRSLMTEKYCRATTVISTPSKKELKIDETDVLTTLTVETGKVVEATDLAKHFFPGATFNGPVTLNFNIK